MGRRRKKGNGKVPSSCRLSNRSIREDENDSDKFDIDTETPLKFSVGSRVELLLIRQESGTRTGTVVGHWQRKDHWPTDFRVPYLVILDDGSIIFCPRSDDDFIRESDVPPVTVLFNIGGRVECQLGTDGEWFPGTVVQTHEDWLDSWRDTPPYSIQFDYGRERPFWGPQNCIRSTNISAKTGNDKSLRFKVGDRVDCSVDDDWLPGIVMKTWYSEDSFEDDHAVPYQVQLDNGEMIWAPIDSDDCIKKSAIPEMPLRFAVGDRVDCLVEEGWTAGMVKNIWYGKDEFDDGHIVPYQIKLFDSGDFVYAPVDSNVFIRRPLRFKVGEKVECLVDEEWISGLVTETWYYDEDDGHVPYQVRLANDELVYCTEDEDICIRKYTASRICRGEHNGFVRIMSKLLIHNEDYDGAEEMLLDRVTFIRLKIENITSNGGNGSKNTIHILRADLSAFLCSLSELHQARGDLRETKAALDEALDLIDKSPDESHSRRRMHVIGKLALHASLTGDKYAALGHLEESILLSKKMTEHDSFRLGVTLFKCGKLNVERNSRERGLGQMSEGVDILTRLCGSDDMRVKLAKKDLHEIRGMNIDGVYKMCRGGEFTGPYLGVVGVDAPSI